MMIMQHMFGMLSAASDGVTIPTHSLSFTGASSMTLSMSDANFGAYSNTKFALAVWVKRASTANNHMIMGQVGAAASDKSWYVQFVSTDKLEVRTYDGAGNIDGRLVTTATYTSTASWYHIVVHVDPANATAGDRLRLWVNGSEVTLFDTDTNPTTSTTPNSTSNMYIGSQNGSGTYFDGLMFQPSFYSGTLPSATTLYNGGAKRSNLTDTGLWSTFLTTASSTLEDDYVLTTNWTNTNSVTRSATIP